MTGMAKNWQTIQCEGTRGRQEECISGQKIEGESVCACVEQWVTLATASPTYATAKARVWTFMQIFWSFWDTHAHITSTPTHNMAWRGEKCANNIYSQHPATLTLHSLRTHEHKKKTCRTNMTHYLTLLTRVSFVFYLLPFCFWFRSVGLLPLLFLVE